MLGFRCSKCGDICVGVKRYAEINSTIDCRWRVKRILISKGWRIKLFRRTLCTVCHMKHLRKAK